jgi:3-oxoadipate enol-lactonase
MKGAAPADARARPPVVVLAGVGLTAAVALRSVAAIQARFHVLSAPLGNEAGGGNADESVVTTPEDVVALLDRAGVERAHIVGFSFGAVIAQEIALRHPERVRSLVLGSSTAGGKLYVAPDRAIRQFLRRLGDLPAEEGLWAAVPYVYADATYLRHAPLIGEDIARRLSQPLTPRSYRAQHAIARAHDASSQLGAITAPTLVMHGEHDRLLPPDNGRLLADGIAGARFVAIPGGAHAFPTDVPNAGRELVSFLRAHSQPRGRPSPAERPPATRSARAGRA